MSILIHIQQAWQKWRQKRAQQRLNAGLANWDDQLRNPATGMALFRIKTPKP